jgi:hypothetical protein
MKLRVLTVLGEAREIQVPDQFTLPDLREAVAKQLALPLDRLKLVKDGAAVAGAAVAALRDGGAHGARQAAHTLATTIAHLNSPHPACHPLQTAC